MVVAVSSAQAVIKQNRAKTSKRIVWLVQLWLLWNLLYSNKSLLTHLQNWPPLLPHLWWRHDVVA